LEAGIDGRVDGNLPLLTKRGGPRRLRLNDGGQLDRMAALFEIAVNTEMIAAEGSGPTDSDVENVIRHWAGRAMHF
jgi:hypothetical protein